MKGQWAVVQNTLELADDPQVQANGYLQDAGVGRRHRRSSSWRRRSSSTAPRRPRGAHRTSTKQGDEILAEELGLDWDAIVDLKVKGVVA